MQRHIESPGMTRAMIRTVALIATTCLPTAGWACADPVPANVPHQMVGEMLGWIEINTDYDMASIAAPAIQFCATDTYITAADGIVAEPALRAGYDPAIQTIYMTAPWSPFDPEITSTLLHLLISHVQIEARDWPCLNATRFEAYWLQDKWLAEQGYGTGFDWTQIMIDSRCPITSEG